MDQPFVSILTPVYNGEEFLSECIESVLAQDYQNWEYHIVNNRSTDGTLRIAQSYAARDSRIRVSTNQTFVSMPQNFNNAFGMVSPGSRYFKVVCADDWILPQCLSKMVRFAEAHPSVGILCCHQQSGNQVRWADLPSSVCVLPGREAARIALLERKFIFGAPTAFLYRSNLLRMGKPFFPNMQPHSDTSACYEFLEFCDYGVVHEILAVERVHEEQITSKIERFAAGTLGFLDVFLQYGPRYLTAAEFHLRKDEVINEYYRFLGGRALKLSGREFWSFQQSRLGEMGLSLEWSKIAKAAVTEAVSEAKSPVAALRKLLDVSKERISR